MIKANDALSIIVDALLLFIRIIHSILVTMYRLVVPVEKSVVGEIVLITGAGHGIGRELALKYASLGAIVVCWDVNAQGNKETLEKIKKLRNAEAYAYECDVTNREQVFALAEKVKEEVGSVTILINNAGIMPCQPFLDHSPEVIRKIFDVNVFAHFWTLQAFLPTMLANNHGHIVCISSMAGVVGIGYLVPYCASKFAVRGIMETLNEEIRSSADGGDSKIKLTTIYPYMVDTGLCKKPKFRFPSLMSLLSPEEAAEHIVTAQRRNYREVSIPSHWLIINHFARLLPTKAWIDFKDFFDGGVDL